MAAKTTSSLKEMASGENSQRLGWSVLPFTQFSVSLMFRLPLMLDGPCRRHNAGFRAPAEGSDTLGCDFCATTTRLTQAEDESLLNACAFGKKKPVKTKIILENVCHSLLIEFNVKQLLKFPDFKRVPSLPSATFTARMHYSNSTPWTAQETQWRKCSGDLHLNPEPERIWIFGTGEPGCKWDRWSQVTKAKSHPRSCWLHSDVYLLRSLV